MLGMLLCHDLSLSMHQWGYWSGDRSVIPRTVALAKKHGVQVGGPENWHQNDCLLANLLPCEIPNVILFYENEGKAMQELYTPLQLRRLDAWLRDRLQVRIDNMLAVEELEEYHAYLAG